MGGSHVTRKLSWILIDYDYLPHLPLELFNFLRSAMNSQILDFFFCFWWIFANFGLEYYCNNNFNFWYFGLWFFHFRNDSCGKFLFQRPWLYSQRFNGLWGSKETEVRGRKNKQKREKLLLGWLVFFSLIDKQPVASNKHAHMTPKRLSPKLFWFEEDSKAVNLSHFKLFPLPNFRALGEFCLLLHTQIQAKPFQFFHECSFCSICREKNVFFLWFSRTHLFVYYKKAKSVELEVAHFVVSVWKKKKTKKIIISLRVRVDGDW